MRRLIIFLLFMLFVNKISFAQFNVQYGFSLDARWEIDFKYSYLSNFRLGAAVAVAAEGKHLMPYVQYTVATFRGGMGSSFSMEKRDRLSLESRVSIGCALGNKYSNSLLNQEGIDTARFTKKIYTMGFLNPSPLVNPFNSEYVSLNGNFIIRSEKFKSNTKNFGQSVGNISLGGQYWDFDYFNDGTPFNNYLRGLGDGKDRYWTGGGFVSIKIKNAYDNGSHYQNGIRQIVIGFDRYTGYFPNAYEVANRLGLKRVPYNDPEESFYNKGRLYFGTELITMLGFMPILSIKDYDKLDIQNGIHSIFGYSLHNTLHKPSVGLNLYYNHQGSLK